MRFEMDDSTASMELRAVSLEMLRKLESALREVEFEELKVEVGGQGFSQVVDVADAGLPEIELELLELAECLHLQAHLIDGGEFGVAEAEYQVGQPFELLQLDHLRHLGLLEREV